MEPCRSVKSSAYVVLGVEERSRESSMILDPLISTVKHSSATDDCGVLILVSSGFCQYFRIWEWPRIYEMLEITVLAYIFTILLWHFSGKSLLSLRFTLWIYISTWMKHPERQERILLESIKQLCDLSKELTSLSLSFLIFRGIKPVPSSRAVVKWVNLSPIKWVSLSPSAKYSSQLMKVLNKD